MGCEESFITMKLIWYVYLVFTLDICVYETPTETGLITSFKRHFSCNKQSSCCLLGLTLEHAESKSESYVLLLPAENKADSRSIIKQLGRQPYTRPELLGSHRL